MPEFINWHITKSIVCTTRVRKSLDINIINPTKYYMYTPFHLKFEMPLFAIFFPASIVFHGNSLLLSAHGFGYPRNNEKFIST